MPTEKKQMQPLSQTQRDVTLVKILERLSNQIHQFDHRMEEMEKTQHDLPDIVGATGGRYATGLADAEQELARLNDNFIRYRNDILKIANEQGRLEDDMKEITKRQAVMVGALETISRDTENLDERYGKQEKAVSEYSQFAVRQGETLAKDIEGVNKNANKLYLDTEKRLDGLTKDIDGVNKNAAKLYLDTEKRLDSLAKDIEGVNRNASKLFVDTEKSLETITRDIENVGRNAARLHEDTEKNLKDEQRDIIRQVEELRKETMRRLIALDKIEATLEIIMIRTEPPVKKQFFLIRFFKAIGAFFSVVLPNGFKKIWWKLRGLDKE